MVTFSDICEQGLPKEWQRLINESGISEQERRENPQTMVNILQFYKETTEHAPDDNIEKFQMAPGDTRQYAATPGMYPPQETGTPSAVMASRYLYSFRLTAI